jgi:hypothetical protein
LIDEKTTLPQTEQKRSLSEPQYNRSRIAYLAGSFQGEQTGLSICIELRQMKNQQSALRTGCTLY